MKKNLFLLAFICLGSLLFAQRSMDLGVGFQYGFTKIFDNGVTLREINEPGILGTFRYYSGNVGFFTRFGSLFPVSVTEGSVTLSHDDFDKILFLNIGFGPSFKIPMGDRFALSIDIGMSINDLTNSLSYRDDLDAVRTANVYKNIKIVESYNDFALGVMGNAGLRFRFNRNVSLEIAGAVSYDFYRNKTYKKYADFMSGNSHWPDYAMEDFYSGNLTIHTETWRDKWGFEHTRKYATSYTMESSSHHSRFHQLTIIPSVSIVWSF